MHGATMRLHQHNKVSIMERLLARKAKFQQRIADLEHTIANLTEIGTEGRMAMADHLDGQLQSVKQKLFEINLEIDNAK